MGKKLELVWEGYGFTPDGRNPDQPFELDEDLEKVVDHFKMVHEMWAAKENARFEDHRADVDCTPFSEDDLGVVEYAFRLACAKVDLALHDRRTLHAKWSVARKFHWRHVEEIDAMWDEDYEKRGAVDSPLGERIYNCECEMIRRKVRKIDKRIARLGRTVALIRHALYVRGQYKSGVEVAEWTGPQIAQMVLQFDMVPCDCQECDKSARDRVKKAGQERGSSKAYIRSLTTPFSMAAQLREMEGAERKKKRADGADTFRGGVIFNAMEMNVSALLKI